MTRCEASQEACDQFWRMPAPRDLGSWITSFMGRRATTRRERFTIFPHAQTELLFHFGSPYLTNRTVDEPLENLATASLFAPKLQRNEHVCGPSVDWFLIQLTPAGCRALLGYPASALLQRDLPLTEFWGDEALDLHARFAAQGDFRHRVDIAISWLRRRRMAFRDDGDLVISAIFNATRTVSIATVAAAAFQCDLGVRRFRDRFCVELGIAPKAWLSLARAERLWTALHPDSPPKFDVFAEFADESHACREFKRVTGLTILEYRTIKSKGDGLVNGGNRTVVD